MKILAKVIVVLPLALTLGCGKKDSKDKAWYQTFGPGANTFAEIKISSKNGSLEVLEDFDSKGKDSKSEEYWASLSDEERVAEQRILEFCRIKVSKGSYALTSQGENRILLKSADSDEASTLNGLIFDPKDVITSNEKKYSTIAPDQRIFRRTDIQVGANLIRIFTDCGTEVFAR